MAPATFTLPLRGLAVEQSSMSTNSLSRPLADLNIKDEIKQEEELRQVQEEQEKRGSVQAEDETDDEQGKHANNHHR